MIEMFKASCISSCIMHEKFPGSYNVNLFCFFRNYSGPPLSPSLLYCRAFTFLSVMLVFHISPSSVPLFPSIPSIGKGQVIAKLLTLVKLSTVRMIHMQSKEQIPPEKESTKKEDYNLIAKTSKLVIQAIFNTNAKLISPRNFHPGNPHNI